MSKEVILTGIRANNDLHIGNYFGALLPIIDMAKTRSADYKINLFVPDLHSFTTPIDHAQLQAQIMHNLKIFVAAGLPLDNPDIRIYRQSYIPAHSELTWILDCFTGFGEMNRMVAFKEKRQSLLSGKMFTGEVRDGDPMKTASDDMDNYVNNRVTVGLFNYPVLMAADILLYGAKYVPVGDDQTQHLEFTRDIAMRMNNQFGDLFVIPEPVAKQHKFFGKDQGLRIRDLIDPTKKMSKSDTSDRGVIFLGDDPGEASRKVMSATTDNLGTIQYNPEKQPGVTNLLDMFSLLGGDPKEFFLGSGEYSSFKTRIADMTEEFIANFQRELQKVNESEIIKKLTDDEKAMNDIANSALLKVQQAVGLRPKT